MGKDREQGYRLVELCFISNVVVSLQSIFHKSSYMNLTISYSIQI